MKHGSVEDEPILNDDEWMWAGLPGAAPVVSLCGNKAGWNHDGSSLD